MTTTHKTRRKVRQRPQHGPSQPSAAPTTYRPAQWSEHLADVPQLPEDLVVALRNKMNLDDPRDEKRADAAIAAGKLALRQKFAEVSGGRWEEW